MALAAGWPADVFSAKSHGIDAEWLALKGLKVLSLPSDSLASPTTCLHESDRYTQLPSKLFPRLESRELGWTIQSLAILVSRLIRTPASRPS